MKKAKILSAYLAFFMLLALSPPVFALSLEEPYVTIFVHETTTYSESVTSSIPSNELSIVELNQYSPNEVENFDLVILEEPALISLDEAVAKSILSSGGILCVETSNTDATLSSLYHLLNEEKDLTIEYSGVAPLGVFLSIRNGVLTPGIITKGTLVLDAETESMNFSEAEKLSQPSNLVDSIDTNDFISHVYAARDVVPPTIQLADNLYMDKMAPEHFTEIFDDYTSLSSEAIGSASMGSIFITQCVYDICSYEDGSSTVDISDVISHIVVDAGELSYVKYYDTQIRTSNSIIEQTHLKSNSSQSISISGGFSADSNNIISGDVDIGTTYTYDTDNQTITNNFVNTKHNIWSSDPTKNWVDSSWVLDPGVRIKNDNATRIKNSAYTSVPEVAFFWQFMGAQTGTELYSTPLEVGGVW